ncbi:Spectrin alpha chain, non-erythrocytic 1 [Lemmus lemmus]
MVKKTEIGQQDKYSSLVREDRAVCSTCFGGFLRMVAGGVLDLHHHLCCHGTRRVPCGNTWGSLVLYYQGKLQKHQAFEAEVQANSGAVVKLDETGNLMISEGHFASETIGSFLGLCCEHPMMLGSEYFMHYGCCVDEWELLLEKMREKGIKLLQAQKLVQYLQECEDVMDWINDKEQHPEEELIKTKQDEVNAAWQRLKGLALHRQGKLFGTAEVQRFNRKGFSTFFTLVGFLSRMHYQGEIDAHEDSFKSADESGQALLTAGHYASDEVREKAFLLNEDLGDSLDSVEALLKKHEDFEKSLSAQEEKITALDEFATKLIQNNHYAMEDVATRRDAVSSLGLACSFPVVYTFSF